MFCIVFSVWVKQLLLFNKLAVGLNYSSLKANLLLPETFIPFRGEVRITLPFPFVFPFLVFSWTSLGSSLFDEACTLA